MGALLLAGCGQDLDTTYGSSDPGSVNGFAVLETVWQERFDADTLYRLNPRIEDFDTLIHLQREPGPVPEASWDHLLAWLEAEPGRQCLVVLRDGAMAPWLLERWLEETRAALTATTDEDERQRLEQVAATLRQRRADEFEASSVGSGLRVTVLAGQHVVGIPALVPERVEGLVTGPAPPMLRLRSTLEGEEVQPLLEADGVTWLGAIGVGGSRLLLAVNAIPLMDAALVDPVARQLLQAVGDELADYSSGDVAWVRQLRIRSGEALPPSILRQLFATAPFSYIAWHLVVLLLFFAWFRAAWLGRVNAGNGLRLEHFSRHVEALAWRLRRSGAWRDCVLAVARHVRRRPPGPLGNEDGAQAAVADLLNPGAAASPRPERSPRDG